MQGEKAYLVINNPTKKYQLQSSPDLITPILTRSLVRAHKEFGYKPIVVLSETVAGNPLFGGVTVRYFLNYPGALGVMETGTLDDLRVAYSKKIATRIQDVNQVLFLPAIDPREIPAQTEKISGQIVYYAAKFRNFGGDPTEFKIENAIEIHRDGKVSTSRSETLKLLAESELCLVFENTSIATEAVLAGTPTVFIPNKFLGEPLAQDELGWEGYSYGFEGLEIAKGNISQAVANYQKACDSYFEHLRVFIRLTQDLANSKESVRPVKFRRNIGILVRVKVFYNIAKNSGLSTSCAMTWNYLNRNYFRAKQ